MLRRILLAGMLALLVPGATALAEDLPETQMTCVGERVGSTSVSVCTDPDDRYLRPSCSNTLLVRFTCELI